MTMNSLIARAGIAALLLLGCIGGAFAADAPGPTPEQQKRHLELLHKGQMLWPIYCNHCHNARDPAEFAPYQWDQIMLHMRTMENLPPEDEAAILEFLKTAR